MIEISDRRTMAFKGEEREGVAFCELRLYKPSPEDKKQEFVMELMTRDEISVMDGGKCILQLRGVRSFFSDKYDLTKHPNFKLTADYDKKYTFDIEKYLNRWMKLKADDVYDVIEI